MIFFYFILVCEAIGTAATPGLLCQPRVIVKMIPYDLYYKSLGSEFINSSLVRFVFDQVFLARKITNETLSALYLLYNPVGS
jgi:hypothetical protein